MNALKSDGTFKGSKSTERCVYYAAQDFEKVKSGGKVRFSIPCTSFTFVGSLYQNQNDEIKRIETYTSQIEDDMHLKHASLYFTHPSKKTGMGMAQRTREKTR